MSHQTSHRLSQYATLAHHRPVVTGSLVAAAVASPAVAGLEIWTVGHDLGNGNITLTATATNFNTNYKINFTQSGNNFHVFNGPVSFITGDFTYAPAMWTGNVSFGSDALDGQASANGVSAHAWKLASGFNYLDRNIGASDVDPHAWRWWRRRCRSRSRRSRRPGVWCGGNASQPPAGRLIELHHDLRPTSPS